MRSAECQRDIMQGVQTLTFGLSSSKSRKETLNPTHRVIYELHPLSKPPFLLLIVKLIQVTILRATHKYSTIWRSNHRRHFHFGGNRHICGVQLELLATAIVRCWHNIRRETQEKDGYRCTYDEKGGDLVYEHAWFRLHQSHICDNIRLFSVGTQLFADKSTSAV